MIERRPGWWFCRCGTAGKDARRSHAPNVVSCGSCGTKRDNLPYYRAIADAKKIARR